MNAHTAEQIITVVAVQTPDRPAAVVVVPEALRRPAASSPAERTVVADFVR